jgi:hypothetical protein
LHYQLWIITLSRREEEFVNIEQTSSARAVQLTLPELQLASRALMPDTAVVTDIVHGRPRPQLGRLMPNRTNWRGVGAVCVTANKAAALTQGGRIAGYGAYDVTDSKFSTNMGPPSCSPPV